MLNCYTLFLFYIIFIYCDMMCLILRSSVRQLTLMINKAVEIM